MNTDYSKEIYKKYYGSENKEVKMFLKDGSIVTGVIVGVYHGDAESGEPFVVKWHLVDVADIQKYNTADEKQEIGTIVNQEDIDGVRLK